MEPIAIFRNENRKLRKFVHCEGGTPSEVPCSSEEYRIFSLGCDQGRQEVTSMLDQALEEIRGLLLGTRVLPYRD